MVVVYCSASVRGWNGEGLQPKTNNRILVFIVFGITITPVPPWTKRAIHRERKSDF